MELDSSTRKLNFVSFIVLMSLQVLDNMRRNGFVLPDSIGLIKNIFLAAAVVIYGYEVFIRYKCHVRLIFTYELKNILLLTAALGLLSVYFMIRRDTYSFETVNRLLKIALPVLVAFGILNTMGEKDIVRGMKYYLILSFFGYFLSNLMGKLTIENFLDIHILESRSPFEDNFFSAQAIGFFIFFYYFRKKPFWLVLSTIFVFFTFKRTMVVYAVIVLVLLPIIKNIKQVPPVFTWILRIGMVFVTLLYYSILTGYLQEWIMTHFGMGINALTMGRSWFLSMLVNSGAGGYGLGSAGLTSRGLEMDLIELYWEVSILGVIAVIWFLSNLGKNHIVNFLMVGFTLFTMLTSHWYDVTYFWIVMYITMGLVSCGNGKHTGKTGGGITKRAKKYKIRWN